MQLLLPISITSYVEMLKICTLCNQIEQGLVRDGHAVLHLQMSNFRTPPRQQLETFVR